MIFLDQFSSSHIWHENRQVCTYLCIHTVVYNIVYSTKFRFLSKTFLSTRSTTLLHFFLILVSLFDNIFRVHGNQAMSCHLCNVHCININYRAQSTLMLQLISSMNITSISFVSTLVLFFFLCVWINKLQSNLIIFFFKFICCLSTPDRWRWCRSNQWSNHTIIVQRFLRIELNFDFSIWNTRCHSVNPHWRKVSELKYKHSNVQLRWCFEWQTIETIQVLFFDSEVSSTSSLLKWSGTNALILSVTFLFFAFEWI